MFYCNEDILLVSFMGMGDPLNNIENVLGSIDILRNNGVEFGLCTMFPKGCEDNFEELMWFARLSIITKTVL